MATQICEEPTENQVGLAVETLKLLADRSRLLILWALLHGEHSVNELADHLGARPAAVSQHLAKLRLGRLVRARKDGTRVIYAADDVHVRQLVEEALFHADHVHGAHPDHERTRFASTETEDAGARAR